MRVRTESSSSLERGDSDRLGVRTKKKHKSLDAISEEVFNRNRNAGVELGGSEGVEIRRSARVRRAPEVLDSSPTPKRKRRKIEKVEREGGGEGLRGQGKVGSEGGRSRAGSSEEELGAWRLRSRLRTKQKISRGKRKLFKDSEDDGEGVRSVKDDSEEDKPCLDGENLGDEEGTDDDCVGGSMDVENEMRGDGLAGEMLENRVDDLGNEETGDVNEEIEDGGSDVLIAKERQIHAETMLEKKVNRDEQMGARSPSAKPFNMSELVKDAENQCQSMKIDPMPSDLAENGNSDMLKDGHVELDVQHMEHEKKVKKSDVANGEIPRARIKEGRRCGLCGGGTDGKPPKKLVTDSAWSDQEAYSGSSASEEFSYDPWDGFGDESGWLGRLLGPVNDRHGIAGIWVHQHCAVWSPEVYFAGLGHLRNIRAALCRGRALKCTRCGRSGATLGCRVDRCPRTYHMPCARASGCNFDHRKFLISCADHRYLFEPHGHQYSQHLKKLKAKKMKFEIRKHSNDASRKDLEAEEKWMEKCGEDEEFLKRETKRLQRDLLRIAPVYIGGSHPEGKNPIAGWESVAGLQNVVQCMKEVVILPLLYPEFFENMGITPPRGILLHGYPGTGKTLTVRALIGACARSDKRIAYFARKGADCLGKYVGDAERQLRLLFQVAEKSQPSIIFFDEIDGLAPVRTRQQDQTHSSVVSTLLALMDGLKSRGSVVVIGATNRPDSVDPALRRPGRFDREIYFPLPSMKDRASILALHTRKWPKPVSGPLLDWVASKTVGFAGADLQALCSQAAVTALKRNCSWHQILSCAEKPHVYKRRPEFPAFEVDERDWLEALSLAPPPCSLREAGMAANEVLGTPLDIDLIPCLLQPLLSLIISLSHDDRFWLPLCLVAAGRAVKKVVISLIEEKTLQNDKWSCLAQNMAGNPNFASEIVRNLVIVGIVKGDASLTGFDISKDVSLDDDGSHQCGFGDNPSGLIRHVSYAPLKKMGYRIMISGAPRSGQKHLASCLLHCFLGNIEIQKIDLATISQEGHGDMEQGILHILMKCSSQRICVVFMPRIDLWAIESCSQSHEQEAEVSPVCELPKESYLTHDQVVHEECSSITSELEGAPDCQSEIHNVSKTWKIFREQLECLGVSSSLIILATSELPCATLPCEIRKFFGTEPSEPEGGFLIEHGIPRFSVEVNGELDQNKLIHLSATNLSRNLIQQFVHVAHLGSHDHPDPNIAQEENFEDTKDMSTSETDLKSVEDPMARKEPPEDTVGKLFDYRNVKEKSTLVVAVTTFGYQILRFPHFAELCWVTSKLSEGPSADIRGPWKGWPFNSCIVRPCQPLQKNAVSSNSNNINRRDKFTLVRGLVAVGLSAYRGEYKSSREVSLEVRKVLEVLVGQINARVQAGKDRYQYVRLLSQVAYLEDMVNNWSHSLRSLEQEDQTHVMIRNLGGASPKNCQDLTVEPTEVEDKPITEGSGFQETRLATEGMKGSIPEEFGASDLNAPSESSQLADLTKQVVDVGIDTQPADARSPGKAVDDKQKDLTVTDEMSPEKAIDVSVDLSHEGDEIPSKLEVICRYSCCAGCISALQELVKKIIIRDMELSGPCYVVEDIHDLVSSLSTNLCSAVRNIDVRRKFRNPIKRKPSFGIARDFESQDPNSSQCQSPETGRTKLINCACHSEKDFSVESQPGLPSNYIFRNGVLVAEHLEESSFHCKYDSLCLSSLVELIVSTKKAID